MRPQTLACAMPSPVLPLTDELAVWLCVRAGRRTGGMDALRPGLFEAFHTDDTYTEQPATATLLHARELPPSGGGATVFIDMAAALKRTPPELRRQIQGRRAVHAYNNAGPGGEPPFPPRECASGQNDRMVDVAHPIVRAHPLTGAPVLYFDLDRATGEVSGMSRGESVALLQRLQDLAEAGPRYVHEWRDHDVLIWDNVACQHAATGDFPTGEPRTMWRAMLGGCVPEPYARRDCFACVSNKN